MLDAKYRATIYIARECEKKHLPRGRNVHQRTNDPFSSPTDTSAGILTTAHGHICTSTQTLRSSARPPIDSNEMHLRGSNSPQHETIQSVAMLPQVVASRPGLGKMESHLVQTSLAAVLSQVLDGIAMTVKTSSKLRKALACKTVELHHGAHHRQVAQDRQPRTILAKPCGPVCRRSHAAGCRVAWSSTSWTCTICSFQRNTLR